MPKTSKTRNIYLRFLNLAQAVRTLPGLPNLEAGEERLLNRLASAWSQGKPYSVRLAMQLDDIGSPATVYRKLQLLADYGLVDIRRDETSSRSKLIVPTPTALAYFDKLSKCFEKASQA